MMKICFAGYVTNDTGNDPGFTKQPEKPRIAIALFFIYNYEQPIRSKANFIRELLWKEINATDVYDISSLEATGKACLQRKKFGS
jgi:hypothetical protein